MSETDIIISRKATPIQILYYSLNLDREYQPFFFFFFFYPLTENKKKIYSINYKKKKKKKKNDRLVTQWEPSSHHLKGKGISHIWTIFYFAFPMQLQSKCHYYISFPEFHLFVIHSPPPHAFVHIPILIFPTHSLHALWRRLGGHSPIGRAYDAVVRVDPSIVLW